MWGGQGVGGGHSQRGLEIRGVQVFVLQIKTTINHLEKLKPSWMIIVAQKKPLLACVSRWKTTVTIESHWCGPAAAE